MLYDKLRKYADSDAYPMHMPGHKRNGSFMPQGLPYDIDITEIHGFDDLHDPQTVLLETAILAAGLYGSREAFLLINGTTVGILAAIGAHAKRGEKILAVNNCHWSTPNAAALFGLEIFYIDTEIDEMTTVPCSVSPAAIRSALEKNTGIKLVIITSPTYEGILSDIESIADVVHDAGCILVVDSAHGAHLGFSDDFPQCAVTSGADIVVVSLHKTLPALTQCSLLHICSERADSGKTKELLSILQTSSPSYILMASIDYCLRSIKSDKEKFFEEYRQNLFYFYDCIQNLRNLSVLYPGKSSSSPQFFDHDPGKIVIITKNTGIDGETLAGLLRNKYKIEVERIFENYVIAMTSICDSAEGFKRLAEALCAIDVCVEGPCAEEQEGYGRV